MRNRGLRVGLMAAALSAFAALPAQASLVYNTSITVSGTGLGAVETLVTGHQTTTGAQVESGCVSYVSGADFFGPCQPAIEGGDEIANGPGGTVLLSTLGLASNEAGSVGVVLNISETGQDLAVTLQDLALLFYNQAGTLVFTAMLDPAFYNLVLTQGSGTGLGGSGFVFTLDAAQAAAVNALNVHRIGGGFELRNTDDGNETMFLFNSGDPDNEPPLPEPTALALFGAGLLAAGFRARRKKS